jgi:hypothetical protein
MPNKEGPDYFPGKIGFEFYQSRNARGKYSQIQITEEAFDKHSPEKFAQLLSEGPCLIEFRRVTYKAGGMRFMKCIKPTPLPRNAFDPRYPALIAVIDLDIGEWRSFYYNQTKKIRRILPKELSYEERKNAMKLTGGDYDKLFPGAEKYHLTEEDIDENLVPSEGGNSPFVLVNKKKEDGDRNAKLREALRKKEEELARAREERKQQLEKLRATDNFNTASGNE